MIECEKCGNELVPGDLKCKICNHFSGRVCKACTRHVPSGKRICDVCGFDLGPEFPFASLTDEGTAIPSTEPAPSHQPEPQPEPDKDVGQTTLPPPLPSSGTPTKNLAEEQTLPEPPDVATVQIDPDAIPTPNVGKGTTQPLPDDGAPTTAAYDTVVHTPIVPDTFVSSAVPEPAPIDPTNYEQVLETCQELLKRRTDLYGLFGRPASGKTCFVYGLGNLLKGRHGEVKAVGNFSLDHQWEELIRYQEDLFQAGIQRPTGGGLHFYGAKAIGLRKRHFSLVDIPGEKFEQIQQWTRDITDFFLTYLTHCKGFFLFLELDPDTASESSSMVLERRARKKGTPLDPEETRSAVDAWRLKRDQMNQMVRFLSVAATVPKISTKQDFETQRSTLSHAMREEKFGSKRVQVPVVLCVSKADLIKDYKFDGHPTIVPGAPGPLGDPWRVVEHFFGKELDNMKKLVPHLKVEWVSSTGENFNPKRGTSMPLGMSSAFQFVIKNPPPKWAMSAAHYQRLARFFGLGGENHA